jgi:hypothetical protein
MAEESTVTTEIVNAVNEAFDVLLFENKLRVCFCCNCLLTGEQKQRWFSVNSLYEIKSQFVVHNVPPQLLKDYPYVGEDTPKWTNKIMISKQSVYNFKLKLFLTCNICYIG